MKRLTALLALALALGLALGAPAFAAGIPETVSGARTVNAAQAKQLFDKGVVFVDLRSKRDFAAGRVPDAVHMEFRKVFSEAALGRHVKRDQPVVIYFDDCRRCAKAVEQAEA